MKHYMNRAPALITSWDKLPVLMTTGEASALLRIPEDGVRRLIRTGHLPAVRIGDKLYRINRDALKEYFCGGGNAS